MYILVCLFVLKQVIFEKSKSSLAKKAHDIVFAPLGINPKEIIREVLKKYLKIS